MLKPRVKVFMSARTGKTFAAQIIDLGCSADPDAIVKIELPGDWGLEEVDTLWAGTPA
ncbi:HDIG domain protein [Pseudomonas syringae pv. delphinii]|nr:HDIG domain protein [Pseudomonas syringae pv. delphinii]